MNAICRHVNMDTWNKGWNERLGMKKRLLFALIFVSMVLVVSTIVGSVQVAPISADAAPTTSLTITKYAPDGTTVVATVTVTAVS